MNENEQTLGLLVAEMDSDEFTEQCNNDDQDALRFLETERQKELSVARRQKEIHRQMDELVTEREDAKRQAEEERQRTMDEFRRESEQRKREHDELRRERDESQRRIEEALNFKRTMESMLVTRIHAELQAARSELEREAILGRYDLLPERETFARYRRQVEEEPQKRQRMERFTGEDTPTTEQDDRCAI